MLDEMGIFRTNIGVESAIARGMVIPLADVMVDTGSELTWIPRHLLESLRVSPERTQRFRVADGRAIEREVGFAIIHCAAQTAADNIVFAEPGDMIVLGARTLEGLNLRIDVVRKMLVDAGPIITGAAIALKAA